VLNYRRVRFAVQAPHAGSAGAGASLHGYQRRLPLSRLLSWRNRSDELLQRARRDAHALTDPNRAQAARLDPIINGLARYAKPLRYFLNRKILFVQYCPLSRGCLNTSIIAQLYTLDKRCYWLYNVQYVKFEMLLSSDVS
jgi:hypothetical protein